MKKLLFICLCTCLLVTGCGNVELKNGENAIVSFNDETGVSSQDLYDKLKDMYGTDFIVDMIDTVLLEKEYDEDDAEATYINQTLSSVKAEAGDNFINQLQYYNVKDEAGFKEYIRLNYRRNLWIEDYAKSTVTDKQIEEYYETRAIGDIEASHILITSNATDEMTDEEKKVKETEAYNKAKDLIKQLDDGADFATLAKEYSEDEASAKNGGSLGSFNRGEMVDTFEEAAVSLEVGAYSKTPVKSDFGYHIIYKTKQGKKGKLEDIKESIVEIITKEVLQNSNGLYLTALEALRSKYEMKIEDSQLNKGYEEYITGLKTGN